MATHSNILAQEIQQTEEPGKLQFMGSQRVGHKLVTEQQQQQHLIQETLSEAGDSKTWMGLIQSVNGLKKKTEVPEQEGTMPADNVDGIAALPWVSTWWPTLQIVGLLAQ